METTKNWFDLELETRQQKLIIEELKSTSEEEKAEIRKRMADLEKEKADLEAKRKLNSTKKRALDFNNIITDIREIEHILTIPKFKDAIVLKDLEPVFRSKEIREGKDNLTAISKITLATHEALTTKLPGPDLNVEGEIDRHINELILADKLDILNRIFQQSGVNAFVKQGVIKFQTLDEDGEFITSDDDFNTLPDWQIAFSMLALLINNNRMKSGTVIIISHEFMKLLKEEDKGRQSISTNEIMFNMIISRLVRNGVLVIKTDIPGPEFANGEWSWRSCVVCKRIFQDKIKACNKCKLCPDCCDCESTK